jgi:hypothetical protein
MRLTGFCVAVHSSSLRGWSRTPPGLESGQTPVKSKPEGRFVVSRESKVSEVSQRSGDVLGGPARGENLLTFGSLRFFGCAILFGAGKSSIR